MPRCVAIFPGKKIETYYDTLTAAFEKARIELEYNGALKVEVYDKYNMSYEVESERE